jgi:hypothetical protein
MSIAVNRQKNRASQQRLLKNGGRLINHAHYYWLISMA